MHPVGGGGSVFFDLTPALKNTSKTTKSNSTTALFQLFKDFNNANNENKRIDILLDIAFLLSLIKISRSIKYPLTQMMNICLNISIKTF